MKRYPDTFGELPLTGVLPSKDSEIRGAIARIAKTNAMLKSSNLPHWKYISRHQPNGYDKATKVKARSSFNWWTEEKIWMLTAWTLREGVWTLQTWIF